MMHLGGLCAVLLTVVFSMGQDPVKATLPPPSRYVADYAGVVADLDQSELNGILQRLEMTTGVQYLILTTKDTKGESLSRYAKRVAVQWKLRQVQKDKGLLFVIVPEDKGYCFEMGPAMREILPADYLDQVAEEVLQPALTAGRVSEGVRRSTERIAQRLAAHYKVHLSGASETLPVGAWGGGAAGAGRSSVGWRGLGMALLAAAGLAVAIRRVARLRRRSRSGQDGLREPASTNLQGLYPSSCFGGGFGAFGVAESSSGSTSSS
jgi:uncharacterized membrane protein YgcG